MFLRRRFGRLPGGLPGRGFRFLPGGLLLNGDGFGFDRFRGLAGRGFGGGFLFDGFLCGGSVRLLPGGFLRDGLGFRW